MTLPSGDRPPAPVPPSASDLPPRAKSFGASRQLAIATAAFALVITAVVTGFQMRSELVDIEAVIERAVKQIETSTVPSVAEAVWEFNNDGLETLTRGIAKLPSVNHVAVRDHEKVLISQGTPLESSRREEYPLSKALESGRRQQLGTLVVEFDRKAETAKLERKYLAIVVANVALIVLLSGFMLLMLEVRFMRHVRRLTGYVEGLSYDTLDQQFALTRAPWGALDNDEVERLSAGVERMRGKWEREFQEREQSNEALAFKTRFMTDGFGATAEIAQVIASSLDRVDQALDFIIQCITRLTDAKVASICAVDGDTLTLLACSRTGTAHDAAFAASFPRAIRHHAVYGEVMQGEVVELDSTARPEGLTQLPGDGHVILMPLKSQHGVIGLLSVEHGGGEPSRPDQLKLLAVLSDQAAIAITISRLFAESRRATAAAQEANQSKARFLATMSHEIRTPMNGALGMLDLLLRTELTTRQLDYASKARTAAQALLGVINDVLDFSKVEAGKMELDPHRFELSDFMRELSVILSANVDSKDIEVLFRLDPRVPPVLVGDATRLRQVLLNLAGNALKFTERGEVVLSIQLRGEEWEGDHKRAHLRFEVIDTGIGIAADKLEHIFDSFSQAEQSTSRRYGGTGLGLSISRGLVALMGGELRVDSRVGEGSRFYFDVVMTLGPAVAPSQPAAQHGLKVLIVDDNATSREILQGMGTGLGWHCDLAAGAQEAVEKVQAARDRGAPPYQVILMDWRMPGLDGWEASQRIRDTLAPRAPIIIMVTAHGRELLAERDEQSLQGLGGYLVKPVTAAMLQDAVAQAIGGQPTARRAPAPAEPRLAGLRLLVVEDNDFNQQVAQELLEREGAAVTLASDGGEGVRAALSTQPPFDAILMDLQMPDIDGFEATRRILAERPTCIVIAMTANAMASDRQACLAAGMRDHVAKPIHLTQLVDSLRRHLNRSALGPAAPSAPASPTDAAEAPVLDPAAALDLLEGDEALYRRLVQKFMQAAPALLVTLAGQRQASQRDDTIRTVHTLKGLAGSVGACALARAAAAQEQALHDGAAQPDEAGLQRLLDDTLAALAAWTPAAPGARRA